MGFRERSEELLEEYRQGLLDGLEGLSEDEVRERLVPSKTTLLGLVKHLTYVEGVWFDQAVTGRTYAEIGIADTPDRSFTLRAADTVESVTTAFREQIEISRRNLADLADDQVVTGRGEHPVFGLLLQVLREHAQHAGHADILREQLLARRSS